MNVRLAALHDKEKWDAFIDKENGSFFHYFDWKYIYEIMGLQYMPLILENESSEIIGILPIVMKRGNYYSFIASLPEGASGGFVLKKDLNFSEKNKAIIPLLEYVDQHFSSDCSTFNLKMNLLINDTNLMQLTEILIKNGFKYKYNDNQLPCTYILELKQPFENNIWGELWDHRLKNKIRKSQKMGVYVKEDKNLKYFDDFFTMFNSTNIRLGSPIVSKDEVSKRVTIFPHKTKLFVALLGEEPLAALLCYYQSSICYLSKLPSYEKARNYDVNTLLASEGIRDACENGYRYCEFGITLNPVQLRWKEQYKGIKIPLKIYEKKYSTIRSIFQRVPEIIKWISTKKRYHWNNPRELKQKVDKNVELSIEEKVDLVLLQRFKG